MTCDTSALDLPFSDIDIVIVFIVRLDISLTLLSLFIFGVFLS